MYIYKITNLINQKVYIGRHDDSDPDYFGSGTYLWNSINKHGIENFKIDRLEDNITDYEYLCERERYWELIYIDLVGKKMMYNLAPCGKFGGSCKFEDLSEEYVNQKRKNMSDALIIVMNKPETKLNVSNGQKLVNQKPEVLDRKKLAMQKFHSLESTKEKLKSGHKRRQSRPDAKELNSQAQLRRYIDNPEQIDINRQAQLTVNKLPIMFCGTKYNSIYDVVDNVGISYNLVKTLLANKSIHMIYRIY